MFNVEQSTVTLSDGACFHDTRRWFVDSCIQLYLAPFVRQNEENFSGVL